MDMTTGFTQHIGSPVYGKEKTSFWWRQGPWAAFMALTIAALLGVMIAGSARAQTLGEIDPSGLNIDGGNIQTRTVVTADGATRLRFILSVRHYGISWGSETRIRVTAPDGQTRLFAGNTDFGWRSNAGTHTFDGYFDFGPVSQAGTWNFQFYDSYNDGGTDHTYNAGSRILICGPAGDDQCVPGGAVDPLELELSASSVTLTRAQAMTPVTATATGGSGNYGFSVSPALPAGLMIDPTTGTISGTPTAAAATALYTVTATDLGQVPMIDNAAAGAETATAQIEITVNHPPLCLELSESAVTLIRGQAMTPIIANASGGGGTYTFSVAPALPSGLMIDTATGTISGTPTMVSKDQTYFVSVTCSAPVPTGNGAPTEEPQPQTATAPVDIEVIEDGARVAQAFTDATGAFMLRRTERMLSAEPRGWRLDRRRQAGGPGSFSLRANDDGLAMRFNTAQLSEGGLWHFWAEGEYSRYTDATGALGARDGAFGQISLGIDRLMHERLALGMMLQLDHAGEGIAGTSDITGDGWMVGPYLSAELRDGLFLAARLGWGRSDNSAMVDVHQNGSPWFAGQFDTTRSLARVALYGTHDMANGLRISPEVDLAWIRDRQDAYTVTDGNSTVAVAGTVAERTRLTLAATLERDMAGREGRLMWFARPSLFLDRESLGGVARDVAAGALELGLRSGADATWQGSASVRFDGIGQSGFNAWALRLDLRRPL